MSFGDREGESCFVLDISFWFHLGEEIFYGINVFGLC